MNPNLPPANTRKINLDSPMTETPEHFLVIISRYKKLNPVKYARKEAVFKRKFIELGGKEEDFKIKIEKGREELEVEIKGLKEVIKSKEEIEAANAELEKKAKILNEEVERLKKEQILSSKK